MAKSWLLDRVAGHGLSVRLGGELPLAALDRMNGYAHRCSIPDDHISPRRSALFMARSVLRDFRDGGRQC